jgi:hypothetical protein
MRKYEIDLPLSYCDGEPIEQDKIKGVRDELLAVFGGFLIPNRRTWKYDGSRYVEIIKVEVVTTDDKVPKKFLKGFKERLKESFRQTDVLITTHRIQTA